MPPGLPLRPFAPAHLHLHLRSCLRRPAFGCPHPLLPSYPILHRGRRCLHLSSVPPLLLPPLVFTTLLATLWVYKSLMLILFQNRIIYMPGLPPGARREKIADYAGLCGGVRWVEKRVRARDGVELGLCVGERHGDARMTADVGIGKETGRRVVVVYFQGNGSSTPPRLPMLSGILNDLEKVSNSRVRYTLVALSYRGYWTSRGRASQKGIELDALATLDWVRDTYITKETSAMPTLVVLWGQSIGAGVATGLTAQHTELQSQNGRRSMIDGLILETPFLSIQSMLVTLYPQRWLPYRYLWPFLRNWWDSEAAIKRIGTLLEERSGKKGESRSLPVLIVSAANDELVPASQTKKLDEICVTSGLEVHRQSVTGALHTDATVRSDGRNAVVQFLKRIGNS